MISDQIKFRGRSIGTKKWIYGSLIIAKTGCAIIPLQERIFNQISVYEVIPETVGQLLCGLEQFNGGNVFVGDIVKISWVDITPEGSTVSEKEFEIKNMCDYEVLEALVCADAIEVIGTMHDHYK